MNFTDFGKSTHHPDGFSQGVGSLGEAIEAINAIVEQGEGSNLVGEIPDRFAPQADPDHYDPDSYEATHSHFRKFHELLVSVKSRNVPECYPIISNPSSVQMRMQEEAQKNLNTRFSHVLALLGKEFGSDSPGHQLSKSFYEAMFAMQQAISGVWSVGRIPDFSLE